MTRLRVLLLVLVAACSAGGAVEAVGQDVAPSKPAIALREDDASVVGPRSLRQAMPAYPTEAWKRGEEGNVTLQAMIGTDGKPKDIKVHKSSGKDYFDQAALDAAKDWTFEPAKRMASPSSKPC